MQELSNEQRLYLEQLVKKTRDVNERNRCLAFGLPIQDRKIDENAIANRRAE